jgi:thiopeptide-type bacteriocin biosynthesis protein
MDWISIHAHHHGDIDALLVDAVRPLMAQMISTGDVTAFFYIRNWNGGPHLRLRVKPAPGRDPQDLIPHLCGPLDRYIREHPGGEPRPEEYARQSEFMRSFRERLADDAPVTAAHVERELPYRAEAGTVLVSYVFDEARFGGSASRAVCEENFWRSSVLALDLLAGTGRDRATRMTWALVLTAAAPDALGLADAPAAAMFRRYGEVGDVIFGAKVNYAAMLRLPRAEQQWETLAGAVREDRGAAGVWRRCLAESARRLRELELTVPVEQIVLDYVHLLVNRLGLPLTDELYLVHLLACWYGRTEHQSWIHMESTGAVSRS